MNGAVRKGLLVGAALAGVIAVAPGVRAGKAPPTTTTPEYHAVEAVPEAGWAWKEAPDSPASSMSGVGIHVETLTSATDPCVSRVGAWAWNGSNGGTTTVLGVDDVVPPSQWATKSHRARAISSGGEYIVGEATERCVNSSIGAMAWSWTGSRWDDETMDPCSNTAFPEVADVSSEGLAAGSCMERPAGSAAWVAGVWRRTDGSTLTPPTPGFTWIWEPFDELDPGLSRRAIAMNDAGMVAGHVTPAGGATQAVVWRFGDPDTDPTTGPRWYPTPLNMPAGYSSVRVIDIAQDGTVLGRLWPTGSPCDGEQSSDGWVKVTWSFNGATWSDPQPIDCVNRYALEATASDGLVAAGTRVEVSGRNGTSYGVRTKWDGAWVTKRLDDLDDSDVRLWYGHSVGLDGSIVATGYRACRSCPWRRMVLFPLP